MSELLNSTEFAAKAKISYSFFYKLRRGGFMPQPFKTIGTAPVWTLEQVSQWIQSRESQPKPKRKTPVSQ